VNRILMAFKFALPKLSIPKPNIGSAVSSVNSGIRFVIVKIIGVLLAIVFFFFAILLIGNSIISVASTLRGENAKVLLVSNHVGKHQTAFRLGGLFQVTVVAKKKTYEKIYCLYPAWPDNFQPAKGDLIQIWPVKQPFAGAPVVEGWAWFILGSLFIVGLVMLEFAFLALMID
jgi:hypothetical protein